MSRLSALRYRLAAYRARIRPGTTAELASLVLRMSDEIDTRERMLDAALRPVPDPAGLTREQDGRGSLPGASERGACRARPSGAAGGTHSRLDRDWRPDQGQLTPAADAAAVLAPPGPSSPRRVRAFRTAWAWPSLLK